MNKTEKQFKKYMEKNIQVKDSYQDVVKRIDFEEEKKNMKNKKLIPILGTTLSLLVVGGVCIIALGNKPSQEVKPKGIVTIDVNPSIELVVDENNKVMSVTGLNDDGKMILVDEEIVNKTLDEAIEIIIEVEKETGFLISGKVSSSENEIKVSISADKEEIQEINTIVSNSITLICDELNIDEKVEQITTYSREVLEQRVLEIDPSLETNIHNMSYEDLLKVIELHHIEISEVYSQELENLYLDVKEHQISFVEKQEIQSLISGMDSLYQEFLTLYSSTINNLKNTSEELENLKYTLLIDPESNYQKAIKEVENAKLELNALRQQIALEEGSTILLEAELKIKESILDSVSSILEGIQETTEKSLELVKQSLDQIIISLEEQEEKFPVEIKEALSKQAEDIENKINETKDQAFENFETKYGEDISRIKEEVKQRKQDLIDSLN